MASHETYINEEKLQDYIDGRLSDSDEAAIAAHLLAHPDEARAVQRLREQTSALKGVGADILTEPVPDRLRSVLSHARQHGSAPRQQAKPGKAQFWRKSQLAVFAYAGAIAAGLLIGWFGHANYGAGVQRPNLALITGAQAHRFYSRDTENPVEFGDDRQDAFMKRIERIFGRELDHPDLSEFGYKYLGGRVLPWSGGSVVLQIYENDKGQRASVVVWSEESRSEGLGELADLDGLRTSYEWAEGLGYAVICDEDNEDFDRVANAVIDRFSSPSN
jgi:anti-sigma factor RsiW